MNETNSTTLLSACMYRGETEKFAVSCEITAGIGIHVIGIEDASVREILLRVVTALQHVGYSLPGKKMIIRITKTEKSEGGRLLTPSATRSGLDLSIALAILVASGKVAEPSKKGLLFIGEIGLDGTIRCPETGMRNAAYAAAVMDYTNRDNDGAIIGWNPELMFRPAYRWTGFDNLTQVIDAINSDIL